MTSSHLSFTEDELAFYKAQTRIDDEEELVNHINSVQAKARSVYPYPCISKFMFTELRSCRVPIYPHVLQLAKERKNAILLDVGCCFGCDLRKVVADGWPVENVIGFDLHQAFWDDGHELFRSTPQTFPAAFIAGDILDQTTLTIRPPLYTPNSPGPRPDLKSIASLTPLQGHVSAICVSSFFHLFDQPEQSQIAQKLASLMSPLPGSTIFGGQRALPVKGMRERGEPFWTSTFCHSPDSWKELWDGEVFEKGTASVETVIFPVDRGPNEKAYWMHWSVTRL